MAFFKSIRDRITIWSVIALFFVVIVGLQIVFSGLGFFIPSFATIKLGSVFYLMLVAAALYFIIKFLVGVQKLERRHVLLLILVTALIWGFFYATKTYLPQFFSIAAPPQFHDSLSNMAIPTSLQSIFTG